MSQGRRPRRGRRESRRYYVVLALLVVVAAIAAAAWWESNRADKTPAAAKPAILYVNQGNGVVNTTNFGDLTSFAASQGFNTLFFQVYRQGVLLFSLQDLRTFVGDAHSENLSIFFALYFTNSSQTIPPTVLEAGEDGVSLDMSALSVASQTSLLRTLQSAYVGRTAVTTTNMTSALRPDLLVLETYQTSQQQAYLRAGIIGSVGVFTTASQTQYRSEFAYVLQNSDGVMVFDYAGLMKSGYQTPH